MIIYSEQELKRKIFYEKMQLWATEFVIVLVFSFIFAYLILEGL